ncbi:MAG TPA: amino acid adenylation domain-containing protein, partial [Thermoanaerobaculia bacterium]|nr:amino acid adenylation domain-containing protein [Thermoanaerobaculia bacterium]
FNYLGQLDQALPAGSRVRAAREHAGANADPRQLRPHALEVSASISGGQLSLAWIFSENLHHRETIERLAKRCLEEMRSLVAFCLGAETPGFTPSDFPLAGLDQTSLDRLAAREAALEDVYPLSPLQQGLLVHSLEPDVAGVYQQQLSCTLSGSLDAAAFERAWQRVVDRQAILRTAFLWEDFAQPLQVVRRGVQIHLDRLDWSRLPPADQRARLAVFLDENVRRSLPLGSAPLMRLALIRLAEDAHVFVWVHHHLILDGWSVGRLIYEVFELYGAERRQERAGLPTPRPFRDYIGWLATQDRARAEAFWRRELAGFTAPTPLGTGPARAESRADGGAYRESRFVLAPASTAAIKSWGQQRKLTLATLVEGAWAFLLSLYSGEEDVVFGGVSAGRPPELPGIEEMVGLFITTLPVRAKVGLADPLVPWLAELQRVQAESRQYEHSPLGQIQAWSEVPPGVPLFESLVVFENYPVTELVQGQGAAHIEVRGSEFVTWNHYPLTLVAEPGDGLAIVASWDTRRFDGTEIGRLLGHLEALLQGLPERTGERQHRLEELEVLKREERQQLLHEWARGAETPRSLPSLPRLFAERARRQPERPAVTAGAEEISYGELDRRSNQLARHLRSLGVGPETRVGVCLPRTVELVVTLLAISKAGGAYLPLEPGLPQERLEHMVRDAGLGIVVTRPGASRSRLAAGRVLDLEQERAAVATAADEALAEEIDPETLAYILYTSGSTGEPKGVMVTHRGLSNYLAWAVAAYGLAPDTRAPLHSPLAFDLTVTSLFAPLVAGGSIDLLPESLDPEDLAGVLERGGYDLIKLTPAHLELLRHSAGSEAPPARVLVIGGEALFGESLAAWRNRHPRVRIVNEYGPTEAVVGCAAYEVPAGKPAGGPVPIGKPVANTWIFLLDRALRPVPAGVTAELYIGGDGVARGYLGRPELTAERFVPDPCSGEPGARLYRSGDLARHRPDGTLEYLGRQDHQVKVRGFRIELGEIEAALRRLEAVKEAVVMLRQDEAGRDRLVAYVVAAEAAAAAPEELRSRLTETLPDYMVPALFVPLAELPLTANGKVDRKRLPEPTAARPEGGRAAQTPASDAERKLAAIWSEVLGVQPIGLDDNFFALGGDSILGLQIASRARRAGLKVATRQVLEHPTIAALAAVIGAAASAAPAAAPCAGPEQAGGAVALTPIQRWFLAQEPVDPHHFNQSLWLVGAGPLDGALLARAAGEVAGHHDALRLRFVKEPAGWSQVLAKAGSRPPFARVDLGALPQERRAAARAASASRLQGALDLAKGPVARFVLFEEEGPSRLLVVAHHLVIDILSWGTLRADLETAYLQLAAGDRMALPPVATSFERWSGRLAEHARRGIPDAERDHWLALARSSFSALAVDGPERGAGTVGDAESVGVSLDAAATRILLAEAPRIYQAEINDILLAGLVQALSPWTRRLLVEVESHGRLETWDDVDVSRTVGWFTAMFPLALDLAGAAEPAAAVRTVREQIRAVPSGGMSWGLLRYPQEGTETARALAAMAAPPVLFNYLGRLDRGLQADSMLAVAGDPVGATRSPRQRRSHLLEINGAILDGRLELQWTFNRRAHRRATVTRWAESFVAALRGLADDCAAGAARRCDAADFPASGLDQEGIDRVVAALAAEGSGGPPELVDLYPLSPVQEGMLYESLSNPGAGAHVEQWSCQLPGELDRQGFERAWAAVVERHDILRTGFHWQSLDRPLQAVLGSAPPAVEHLDWRDLPPAEQRRRGDRHLAVDAARGFDLSRPPLLRLALVRLGSGVSRLLWTHHHIVLDGWCRVRLLGEVLHCYEAAAAGREPDLPPSPQYGAYIAWLMGRDLAAAEDFWRGSLSGFTAPTPLGRAGELLAPAGTRHGWVEVDLDGGETEGLRQLAQRLQITLNTVLQAAWGLLLHRYSGCADVLFGITISGRPEDVAFEETIGPFINTLPVRLRIAPERPAASWLQEIQALNLDLRQHEFTPGSKLREWSAVPASEPLYHSILVFENYPLPKAARTGAVLVLPAVDDVVVEGARTQHAAALLVHPSARLNLRLVVDRGRLAAAEAPRILAHLRAVLGRLAAAPEQSIGELLDGLGAIEIPVFAGRRATPARPAAAAQDPRTPTEELVAGAWAEVLGLPFVGRDESFFSLGGHSLVATQIISRLRAAFGRELPLRLIFETGTVSGLAAAIDAEIALRPGAPAAPPIAAVGREGESELSFAEQRLWFLDHLEPGQAAFNIPVGFRLEGALRVPLLEQALGEIVRRHESLRTSFPTLEGRPVRRI